MVETFVTAKFYQHSDNNFYMRSPATGPNLPGNCKSILTFTFYEEQLCGQLELGLIKQVLETNVIFCFYYIFPISINLK